MYVKVTHSGPRRYVQLVESYRDEEGKVKQRTIATLGRLDQMDGSLDSVIGGLMKVTGREAPAPTAPPTVTFESTRALGISGPCKNSGTPWASLNWLAHSERPGIRLMSKH